MTETPEPVLCIECSAIVCDPATRGQGILWRLYLRNVDLHMGGHSTEVQGRCRYCGRKQKHFLLLIVQNSSQG